MNTIELKLGDFLLFKEESNRPVARYHIVPIPALREDRLDYNCIYMKFLPLPPDHPKFEKVPLIPLREALFIPEKVRVDPDTGVKTYECQLERVQTPYLTGQGLYDVFGIKSRKELR